MTAVLHPARRGRDLVDSDLFARLVGEVTAKHPQLTDLAAQIVDQALVFVATAAEASNGGLRPSTLVDHGWHTLLDHHVAYEALCARHGRYVHHVPDDGPDRAAVSGPSGEVARTIEAIERARYVVDLDLWPLVARCTSCHEEGGCRSGGQDGNENTDTRKKDPRG
ncbi:MAG TPA: hypothetical protein VM677_06010 [Actinokineospora sp.]|nr:hypothetical protein [Actinokineospora sp.]